MEAQHLCFSSPVSSTLLYTKPPRKPNSFHSFRRKPHPTITKTSSSPQHLCFSSPVSSTLLYTKPPRKPNSFHSFRRKPHPTITKTSSSPFFLPITNTHHFRLFSSATTDSAPGVVTSEDVEEGEEKFDWFSHWYPLAPVCDLDKRVPHAKTVLGIDVVVWWDRAEEKWQVFEDKCPHRLAPLSEGRIDQWGRLQCVYHGWCFDGEGSCKFIPQAPRDGPEIHTFKKACAIAYPSFEQNKIVWFWPNSDPKFKDIALAKKPPYIPEIDDPSYASLMGIRDIPYGYEVLIENLMDPSHVPYAHYGIMKIAENPNKIDREGGRPLDITIQTMNSAGFVAKQTNALSGHNKFIAPCVFTVLASSGSSETSKLSESTTEVSSSLQKKEKKLVLVFICIPVSPGRSRLIWTFPRNFAVWIDRIMPRWIFHLGQNLILDSDLYLLHLEERKIAEVGASNWQKACFVPTKADTLVVAFRKWIKKYADDQINWKNTSTLDLPPTPPREQLLDRYRSHVVQCSSCNTAVKGLKVLEVALQIIALASIGIVAALKQNVLSTITRSAVVSAAMLCFLVSRWLSHFIYKNFYYHDYNHALK